MELYRLKACTKCGGDLAYDEGDWICLQCGTYYYVGLYRRRPLRSPPAGPEEWSGKEARKPGIILVGASDDRCRFTLAPALLQFVTNTVAR